MMRERISCPGKQETTIVCRGTGGGDVLRLYFHQPQEISAMKSKLIFPGVLAAAITALIPFAGGAVSLGEREAVVTPAQSQADPVIRFMVNYRVGALARNNPEVAVQGINRALSRSGISLQGAGGVSHLRTMATGHDLFKLPAVVDRVTANAILAQIAADRDVVSVEVDEIMRRTGSPVMAPNLVPDDTAFEGWQWHYHRPDGNTDSNSSVPNYGGINAIDAWDMADGTGTIVAVLDTGITRHPDLDTSLGDVGYDFITDGWVSGRGTDGRAPGGWDLGDWTFLYTTPPSWCTLPNWFNNSSWHGTHVAGTVGAELTNNGAGMAGIAHGGKVLPVRVLGHCGGFNSDLIDAIVWAAGGQVPGVPDNQNPAHVINMSLGGGGACSADSALGMAVAEAISRGTVVVAAAGNSNSDTANSQPASCPGVIAVAATRITSERASYSNYGQRVDISAPGGGGTADVSPGGSVWQAWNGGLTTPTPLEELDIDVNYIGMSGTSMATPHVAGVVALMQSVRLAAGDPLLTPDEVLAILQDTATPFEITPDQPIGVGIVDAAAAVAVICEEYEECQDSIPTPPAATEIFNRIPVSGLSGEAGSEALFMLEVPDNVRGPVSILTNRGSGDVALYARYNRVPSADLYDHRSARRGNNETIRFTNPQPGTYYILLRGEPSEYNNVTLRAVFELKRQ